MKRTLLLATVAIIATGASAQCTPNQLYADSVYGVWPDTTENFMAGSLNVFYSDTLNILVPTDAGLINPNYAGLTIDSVALVGVDNLPPGLSVVCNSQTGAACTFLTNQLGCGLIEGTPTTAGTFEMTLNVTAYAFIGFVLPVDQSFGGYRITINEDNSGVNTITAVKPMDVRAVPNPVIGKTSFVFQLNRATKARVRVYNLVGEKLWDRTVSGKQGTNTIPFDATELESGMYIYSVEAGGNTFTSRIVVN